MDKRISENKDVFDRSAFGKKVKLKRDQKKMTQEELAERIDRSSKFLCMVERGKRAVSIDVLYILSKELDTSSDYLLSLSDDETTYNVGKNDANKEMIKVLVEEINDNMQSCNYRQVELISEFVKMIMKV